MSNSRASHQCHRDGCDSEAQWQMFVKFVSRTREGVLTSITGKHSICVCDRHRKDAAESFVGERNMDFLAIGLGQENLMCPHPRSIQIEFAHIREASDAVRQ